jgi:hypothetical protein
MYAPDIRPFLYPVSGRIPDLTRRISGQILKIDGYPANYNNLVVLKNKFKCYFFANNKMFR